MLHREKKKKTAEVCVPAPVGHSHSHERFLPVSVPAAALETGFVNCLRLEEEIALEYPPPFIFPSWLT